jgi:formamidopyrimidine-DNA glycosylase
MPELPDILLYLHALRPRLGGRQVCGVRLASPFLLRSIDPPLSAVAGRRIVDFHRLGKRIAIEAEGELFLVFHLMIAGRFRWKEAGTRIPGKVGLFALDFDHGTLILTEAGTKRQASLYVVQGRAALAAHNPGGLEVLDADGSAFARALPIRTCSAGSAMPIRTRSFTQHASRRSSRPARFPTTRCGDFTRRRA